MNEYIKVAVYKGVKYNNNMYFLEQAKIVKNVMNKYVRGVNK